MESNKSVNKVSLFIKIWLVHIVVYYTVYVIVIRIFKNDYEAFYLVLLGFVGGLMGISEQVPYFVVIPIFAMVILINTCLKNNWFKAYILSVGVCYLVDYAWMVMEGKHDKLLLSTIDINLIYLIIPSLMLAILGNWLLLKNRNNCN